MDGKITYTLLLLQLTLFLAHLQTGSAIKCYECNSKKQAWCADPFNSTDPNAKLVECSPPLDQNSSRKQLQEIQKVADLMTKLGQPASTHTEVTSGSAKGSSSIPMSCQKLEIDVIGELVTGRGCVESRMDPFEPCDIVKLITSENINMKSCSICNSDGCNSALLAKPFTTLLLLAPLLLLGLSRH